MSTECKKCLNVEVFDTLFQRPIRITSNGLCNQCIEWEENLQEFNNYRQNAREQLPKIFKKIKEEKHEYDALVSLSGGKDSSTALILAKKKYNLNILAFTTDKGNFYNGVKEKINDLTDRLGVDHIFVKAPKPILNKVFQFGITTLSTGGIQCKICGGLVHIPILSRFMLNYDIPSIITGLDLWEIQGGYNYHKNRNIKLLNPFLYTFPFLRNRWNNYEVTIEECSNLLERFSKEDEFPKLKWEFMEIVKELIQRYGLNAGENKEFKKMNFYDIGLTAIEISSKKEQLDLLKNYGWTPPKDMYTGEIVGTDCKIGGLVNAITTFKQKRKMWSYRIRSGLVSKEEAIEEITKTKPNIEQICYTLKQTGLLELKNRLRGGWNNHIFKDLYNIDLINEINARLI